MATAVRAITAITLVATALTGCSSKPQASPPRSGSVWVADEGHDSVSVIDTESLTTIREIPVGELPWGVVIHP